MQIKKAKTPIFFKSLHLIIIVIILATLVFGRTYIFSPTPTSTKQNINKTYTPTKELKIIPDEITLEVTPEDYKKIKEKRKEALTKGILLTSSKDYVPSTIYYKNKKIPAKIRLKGDWSDHWGDKKKWSFRVEIKGDQTLFGMKSFSLQQPKTRGYLAEWIFHKILEDQGLIHLRYDFIKVSLNNTKLGVYAIEEHFEKRLLENNQRRESPIVKIDDYLLWLYRAEGPTIDFEETYSYEPIKAFNQKSALKNKEAKKSFQQATNLLELFRRRKLKTHEVFDSQKMGTLMAITDLMGHFHSTYFHNMRFYYNPITNLIEPIGYDNGTIIDLYKWGHSKGENRTIEPIIPIKDRNTSFISTIFEDKETFQKYVQALEKISNKKWLDDFFQKNDDEIKAKLKLIHQENPNYNFQKDKETLYKNQKLIKKLLIPEESILAYYQGINTKTNKLKITLANIQKFPIEIIEISYKKDLIFKPQNPPLLNSKQLWRSPSFTEIEIPLPKNYPWKNKKVKKLKVKFRILGLKTLQETSVLPWPYLEENFYKHDIIRQKPNQEEFNFIHTDNKLHRITIDSGTLSKSLIIPKDHTVIVNSGTKLDLKKSAKILSYSPINFLGTEDSNIIIESSDKTGQGIVIMNAEKDSTINYTQFKNLSAPQEGNWDLTGAVNFYKSPVKIQFSHFLNNQNSDDALNIIHSNFNIKHSLFENSYADAIDVDFGTGSITDSSFINCGINDKNGDCLDFSGSLITLSNLKIKKAGDKAISAGEKSQITAKFIEIEKANIGFASKDRSKINIESSTISNSQFGLTAYQKKAEYGPSQIKAKNITLKKVSTNYLSENDSTITIDEKTVPNNSSNAIKSIYKN